MSCQATIPFSLPAVGSAASRPRSRWRGGVFPCAWERRAGVRRHRIRHSVRSQRVSRLRPARHQRRGLARPPTEPPTVLMLDALTGEEVTRVPTGPSFRDRFKHPYIIIHRIDLHGVSARRVPAQRRDRAGAGRHGLPLRGPWRPGHGDHRGRPQLRRRGAHRRGWRCARARARNCSPTATHCPTASSPIAPSCRWIEVTADVPRDVVVLWGGPGFHIVHYPLRHGTLFNIVAVFRSSTHSEKGDVASYRAELQHTYRTAHPSMKALLAMMDLGRRWAVGDRDPIRHWHQGRAVLLGDAAHPTLQSLAQGACMAIEDGLCLAYLIPCRGRAISKPRSASTPAARQGADRARDIGVRAICGRSITPTALTARCGGRCSASAPSRTSLRASPGSTTDFRPEPEQGPR